jgi:hypothetical protein
MIMSFWKHSIFFKKNQSNENTNYLIFLHILYSLDSIEIILYVSITY